MNSVSLQKSAGCSDSRHTDAGSSLPLIRACLILLHGSLETFCAATKEARASNAPTTDNLAILDTGIG